MIRDWDTYALPDRERAVLHALSRALYASSEPTTGSDDAIREAVGAAEAWLGAPGVLLRTALRGLLLGLELSPVRFGFGARTMSGLPLDARVAYLRALDEAGSAALEAWKSILGMAYFGRPEGLAHMDVRRLLRPRSHAPLRLSPRRAPELRRAS